MKKKVLGVITGATFMAAFVLNIGVNSFQDVSNLSLAN